jgi:hypothetical protein
MMQQPLTTAFKPSLKRRWETNDFISMFCRLYMMGTVSTFLRKDDMAAVCICNLQTNHFMMPLLVRLKSWDHRYLVAGSEMLNYVEILTEADPHRPLSVQLSSMPTLVNVEMHSKYNTELRAGMLPNSITTLRLGDSYNQRLSSGALPSSLTDLHLGSDFNQEIAPDVLPTSILELTFSEDFNQPLYPGSLPPAVQSIMFGTFNHPIENVLPQSITYLDLGSGFNQPILSKFHEGLKDLSFGFTFNRQLHPNILPSTLVNLELGHAFNQPLLDNVLPRGLQDLTLHNSAYQHDIGWHAIPYGCRVLLQHLGRTWKLGT